MRTTRLSRAYCSVQQPNKEYVVIPAAAGTCCSPPKEEEGRRYQYQLLTIPESKKLHLSDVTGDIISPSVSIQNPNLK